MSLISTFAFRVRTRSLAREIDTTLALRRRGPAQRQDAARRGARTRLSNCVATLKPLEGTSKHDQP